MPGLVFLMTAPSDAVMSFSYDPLQAGLSVLIAIAASYAALDLAERVMAKRKVSRAAWLAGGAVSMGSGIWAMHFVGMLAFHTRARGLPLAHDGRGTAHRHYGFGCGS